MLGKSIQELRTRKGISMSELADRAGVTKSYVNALERGIKTNPSIQVLEKISTVLDMDLESLVRYVHDRQDGNIPFDHEWVELIRDMKESGISKEILKSWKDAWTKNQDEGSSKYSS
ncbi:XRE family transcriptional regulator [Brevibacillus choshinensis]|uniref:Helix-turn-helix domain-containing protein n=1 Tax=Brevibacillus choshinensis TaxID=54911 RepID=A0ABX7FKJ2_BRECH|nr:XRE family transcriptional regulator [Brevibacillus choshinensis]QRG66234.1 helix-turn-helix domain-containing protein [Brevibacillus choshinensis]